MNRKCKIRHSNVLMMRDLRKPCSIIHFGRNRGFHGGHFEIGHINQLINESSIGNLIQTEETNLLSKTICKKMKKNDNFEKLHFATYLQYPK